MVEEGKYVKFGKYEQDNDLTNGKEDIEWLVLEVKDGKALVVSKYSLDCKLFNESDTGGITWENCTLREWLNSEFVNEAFTNDESGMIPTVTVTADKNPDQDSEQGADTQDKLFLMSVKEVNKYFKTDEERKCEPTAYAIAQGASLNKSEKGGKWWLRTVGISKKYNTYMTGVGVYGDLDTDGMTIQYDDYGIRPAMWINLDWYNQLETWYRDGISRMEQGDYENATIAFAVLAYYNYKDSAQKLEEVKAAQNASLYNNAIDLMNKGNYADALDILESIKSYGNSAEKIEMCGIAIYGKEAWNKIKNIQIGDIYTFGSYEQDNNWENGKEDIEWIVVDKQGSTITVVSKYALSCRSYHFRNTTFVTWETADIRDWLNETFLNDAFSEEQQKKLREFKFQNADGSIIYDKITLMSSAEANLLFETDEARKCLATDVANQQAYPLEEGETDTGNPNRCWWWLRTNDDNYAYFVRGDGKISTSGERVDNDLAVRPMIAIDLNLVPNTNYSASDTSTPIVPEDTTETGGNDANTPATIVPEDTTETGGNGANTSTPAPVVPDDSTETSASDGTVHIKIPETEEETVHIKTPVP